MKFRGIFGVIAFLTIFSVSMARAQQTGFSAPPTISPVQPFVSAPVQPFASASVQPFISAPVQPFMSAPVQPFVSAPVQPFASAPVAPLGVVQGPGIVPPAAVMQVQPSIRPVIVWEPAQTFSPQNDVNPPAPDIQR
jgi:hypothetical protein